MDANHVSFNMGCDCQRGAAFCEHLRQRVAFHGAPEDAPRLVELAKALERVPAALKGT